MNWSGTRVFKWALALVLVISIVPLSVRAKNGVGSEELPHVGNINAPGTTIEPSTTSTTVPQYVPRVLLVGDSTMAGLRWFRDAPKALDGGSFIIDVESCRSIAGKSCYGREQRIPSNAYTAIHTKKERLDVVVLMAGTHSEPETIESEFRSVRRLVEAKDAKLVVLTLRPPLRLHNRVTMSGLAPIARINLTIDRLFHHVPSGKTYVADWRAFSEGRGNWFRRDGIHLNIRGALALGWYLSRVIARVAKSPCTSTNSETCSIPTPQDSMVDWLRRFHVKYTETHCYEDGSKRTKICERDRRLP